MPMIVTYASVRHLYLASTGFAIALGLVFNALWMTRRRLWQSAAAFGGAVLVLVYVLKLLPAVSAWNTAGSISEKMVRDVERQAADAPAGSLLSLGAPSHADTSYDSGFYPPLLWSWALPFAVQPPFTRTDLTERFFVISPMVPDCCPGQWFGRTQRTVRAWSERADRPPVIALRWDPATGALARQSDAENPRLRDHALSLADANTCEKMEKRIGAILTQMRFARR